MARLKHTAKVVFIQDIPGVTDTTVEVLPNLVQPLATNGQLVSTGDVSPGDNVPGLGPGTGLDNVNINNLDNVNINNQHWRT